MNKFIRRKTSVQPLYVFTIKDSKVLKISESQLARNFGNSKNPFANDCDDDCNNSRKLVICKMRKVWARNRKQRQMKKSCSRLIYQLRPCRIGSKIFFFIFFFGLRQLFYVLGGKIRISYCRGCPPWPLKQFSLPSFHLSGKFTHRYVFPLPEVVVCWYKPWYRLPIK